VTFDSDYYELSLINGCPPKIIWIRTGNPTTNQLAQIILNQKDKINKFLDDSDSKELACLELE